MLRFAPSPTGDMHIGNLRVAIFNYIVSRQRNEELVVRIDDSDQARNIEGKDKEILDILSLFGIRYEHLIYQSNNIGFYRKLASKLLIENRAFNCFCSQEEIEAEREDAKRKGIPYRYSGKCANLENVLDIEKPSVIRLRKPTSNIAFQDIIKGQFSISPNEIDSFILLRQNKYPTYNFASAVDDMLNDISIIIRGEDHLSNTPKQIAIWQALGYEKSIEFAHLPIILNEDGKKMSKRDKGASVKWLLEEGYIPEAITNYLILLGNKVEKEIFSLDEAISWFRLENISKSPAKFSIEKLRFINRKQIELLPDIELSERLEYKDARIGKLGKVFLEEASTIVEIKEKVDLIFSKKEAKDENIVKIANAILSAPAVEEFGELKKKLMKTTGLKGKSFFKPLRYLLTGRENGPELSKIYPLIFPYLRDIIKLK